MKINSPIYWTVVISLGGVILKLMFTVVAFLLTMSISTSAFAHSHLGGSNPADGDVVKEPLNEIVLEFDGQIEQGSFIDLTTTEGQAIDMQEIIIGEGTLTGTLAEPLPNDEYKANWSIISADGHPLEGEFTFTVNAPVSESVDEESEEPSESTESSIENQDETSAEEEVDETEETSSSTTIMLIVIIAVILVGGFFLLRKRKK